MEAASSRVPTGGAHPGVVDGLIDALGIDGCICIRAGGIHGHPDGSHADAKALRRSADAGLEGISLESDAEDRGSRRRRSRRGCRDVAMRSVVSGR